LPRPSGQRDRFAILTFATTVNRFGDGITEATSEQIDKANRWLDKLDATGGTAMDDALQAALDLQRAETSRSFTVAFFTDGKPTLGVTDPEKILANVARKNTGADPHLQLRSWASGECKAFDRLAEQSRDAAPVLPSEDLEAKVSAFYDKISRPVLARSHLDRRPRHSALEMYRQNCPTCSTADGWSYWPLRRFGRCRLEADRPRRQGEASSYEAHFPARSDQKPFVEELWARRKIGYLLDQIRATAKTKELVDAVTALAKKYGIATPYTSWLVVPDTPVPIVRPPHSPLPPRPPWPPRPVPYLLEPVRLPARRASWPKVPAKCSREERRLRRQSRRSRTPVLPSCLHPPMATRLWESSSPRSDGSERRRPPPCKVVRSPEVQTDRLACSYRSSAIN
jgi:Ca-activated chloride channel family protein